jgi:predicted nuclease with TOPRIM domain
MPLTPKDEISESRGEQQAKESGGEALAELRDRVDDLDERTRGVTGEPMNPHEVVDDMSEAVFAGIHDLRERVDELEERVDRHENVLFDLLMVVEYVSANMGERKLKNGKAIVENESSDAVPIEWHDDVWRLKSERFE